MIIKKSLAGLFIAALVTTGCSSSKAPGCADSATKDMVIQIASKEIASSFNAQKGSFERLAENFGGKLDDNITSIDYSVEAIRVSERNDKTGSHSCKANLVAKANGSSEEVPITYTSELANEGDEFYVEVFGLDQETQGELLSVLIVL